MSTESPYTSIERPAVDEETYLGQLAWIEEHCRNGVSVWIVSHEAEELGGEFTTELLRLVYEPRDEAGKKGIFSTSGNPAVDQKQLFEEVKGGWPMSLDFRFTDANEAMRFKLTF